MYSYVRNTDIVFYKHVIMDERSEIVVKRTRVDDRKEENIFSVNVNNKRVIAIYGAVIS